MNTKRPAEIAPPDEDMAPALVPNDEENTAILGRGKVSAAMLRAKLLEAGATPKHVGGSLPLLPFDFDHDAGKAYLLRYQGTEKPSEDTEFDLIQFDVLDWERFDPKKPASDEALLYKAQLVASYALRSWAGAHARPAVTNAKGEIVKAARAEEIGTARKGDVVILTYGGQTSTKRGQSPLKLFSVELVASAPSK